MAIKNLWKNTNDDYYELAPLTSNNSLNISNMLDYLLENPNKVSSSPLEQSLE